MTDYPRSTESIVRDTNVPFPRAGTSLDEPGADCVPDGDDEDGDDAATPTAEDPEERSVRLTLKEYVDAQSAFGEPIPTPTPRLNHELNILLRYHSIRLDLKDASALNVVENLRRDGIVRGEEGAYEKFATDAYMKMRRQLDYEAKTVTVRIDNRTMTVGELKDFLLRNMQRREFIQSSVNQAMNPNKAPGADFEGQGDKRRLVLTKRRLNNATPQTEPEKLPW